MPNNNTKKLRKLVSIDGVDLILSKPDVIDGLEWIGNRVYMQQLLAAWLVIDLDKDIAMNPQILGKPGVGKTTLAYCAAQKLKQPVYIYQCTVDTRPEDLLITPVIGEGNSIKYHASSLVTAMIEGGICILDEGNRMAEKSWASLAPLLDQRRYIESIIAGIKIKAHPNFRICVTMNEDSSTFEIPEYIHSRLQPQIFIEFPDREDEFEILKFNLPYAKKQIIAYVTQFLQKSHKDNKPFTVRDGINICRYYLKLERYKQIQENEEVDFDLSSKELDSIPRAEDLKTEKIEYDKDLDPGLLENAIKHVLGKEGIRILNTDLSENKRTKYDPTFFDNLTDDDLDIDLDGFFEFKPSSNKLDDHFWEEKHDSEVEKNKINQLKDFDDLKREFNIEIKEIPSKKSEDYKQQNYKDYLKIIEDEDEKEDLLKELHEKLQDKKYEDKNELLANFIKKQKDKLEREKKKHKSEETEKKKKDSKDN